MKNLSGDRFIGLVFFLILSLSQNLSAEEFRFKYIKGDKYRILSTVHEDIYINRKYITSSEILNKIAVSIEDVRGGSGIHEAVFQTSEEIKDGNVQVFSWTREYRSRFERDERGRFSIGKEYWMPVVRNVPIFPEKKLIKGSQWTYNGEEVHDFRDGFGIQEPYRIPFTAQYTYDGPVEREGKKYERILVSYRIFHEGEKRITSTGRWPLRIMGASDQKVYWDPALGQATYYSETFRFVIDVSDGNTLEYRGTAEATLIESAFMDRERIAYDINEDIKLHDLKDTNALASEEGVTIRLENLRFVANTAELLAGEEKKLSQIAQILQKYRERDILIQGHAASINAPAFEEELSLLRARAIAEYLIANGIREKERIVIKGFGATVPIAPNDSEANMTKNRRVEIILLEN